jgi:hypothetical protein
MVIFRAGVGEEVVGEAELGEELQETAVIIINNLLRLERPSSSAFTVTGVPCVSEPETIRTWFPRSRWYRA